MAVCPNWEWPRDVDAGQLLSPVPYICMVLWAADALNFTDKTPILVLDLEQHRGLPSFQQNVFVNGNSISGMLW